MATFSREELEYLSERRLGRLATVDAAGMPHVVPIGMWRYNEKDGTLDVTGRDFSATRKFRNVEEHPSAAFLVDDLASVQPWRPRAVMVQGRAEALRDDAGATIRIYPEKIVSWGLER